MHYTNRSHIYDLNIVVNIANLAQTFIYVYMHL